MDGAPPIRGRAEHVAVVDTRIANLVTGHGAVLLIEGPPGIGKSRLLAETTSKAKLRSARVLLTNSYEDQQTVPFAPLFEAMTQSRCPICDPASLRALSSTADARYWVVDDVQNAIADAAAVTPLLIAIDDLHWADTGTLVALRTLVTGLRQHPVLWVFTMRPAGGRPEVRDAILAIAAAAGDSADRLVLGALDDSAVALIAGDVIGAQIDDSVLRMATMAHGNPFLVMETLLGLSEEHRIQLTDGRASIAGDHLPQRLTATMQRRLDRLTPRARHAVQVASLLPARFTATLLTRALADSPAAIMALVDESIRADLLLDQHEHLAFRHDLLRRATQQTVPHALRRAIERETATIMLELGSAPEEVATRLARSADVGDVSAVNALRQAAQSLRRSDVSGAADLSRRALDLLRPDDGLRAGVVAETVVLLNQALRYDEAQTLAAASLTNDMTAEEEATIRLTQSIVSRDTVGRRAEENIRALQLSGVSVETRSRNLAWLAHNLAGDGQTSAARDAAVAALAAVDETDDVIARTITECALARINCFGEQGRAGLQRLVSLQPHPSSPEYGLLGAIVAFDLASTLATMGHLAEASTILSEAIDNSPQIASTEQVLTLAQAHCEYAVGRLHSARALVESVVPDEDRFSVNLFGGVGFTVLAAVAAHTDDRELLRRVGIAARRGLGAGPAARREVLCALAHEAWQRDDHDEASRWLGEEFDLLATPLWTVSLDHVVLSARIARTSSDAGLRQRVLAAAETLERAGRAEALFAAIAVHVRGLLEEDAEALAEAAKALAGSTRPLLHAAAVEDLGHAFARRPDAADQATEHFGHAFDLYSEYEANADARRVVKALHGFGVYRRLVRQRAQSGWDSLTASELRVLELVADGASNPDVARRLGISPHTVNTHVRNVFAKLGVHSRAELARLARGDG